MIGSSCRERPEEGRPAIIFTFYPEINELEARFIFIEEYCTYVKLSSDFHILLDLFSWNAEGTNSWSPENNRHFLEQN